MFKLFNCLTLALFYAILFGCDDGPASNYPLDSSGTGSSTSSSSDFTVVGTTDAAAPVSFPSGTKISFNPEIVFDGELSVGFPVTALYTNSSSSNSLPVGDNDSVSVRMTIVGGGLQVSFTHGGKSVELVLKEFKDFGAGYVEEFTVETKVNGTSLGKEQGRFVGSVKPKNTAATKVVNTHGAPTIELFKRFVVGKALYHEETSPNPGYRKGFLVFNEDGTIYRHVLSPKVYDIGKQTWSYDYNGGTPILKIRDEHIAVGNSNHYHIRRFYLKFDNFFEGTYEGITEEEDGIIEPLYDNGFWQIFDTASLSTNQ
jgi:hypothetical protein